MRTTAVAWRGDTLRGEIAHPVGVRARRKFQIVSPPLKLALQEPRLSDQDFVTSRFGVEIKRCEPTGETAMTDAERQARYRAARASGTPVIRVRRALDHRGRARRWTYHVAGLMEAQVEYAAWFDSLPDSLQDGATTAETRRAIRDLDLTELHASEPPRGFGGD